MMTRRPALLTAAKVLRAGKGQLVARFNDFGDLLDFFALDRHTRAILLYIEAIKDARKFMSAARAAARARGNSFPSRKPAP